MNVYDKLNQLKSRRQEVRDEIRELMTMDLYYSVEESETNRMYRKVSALTGLETYLNYKIDEVEGLLSVTEQESETYID